jgi:hypothetical protein
VARRYSRDNSGRFASAGSGATARGGRLKTASGNRRAAQTSRMTAAPRAGTVGKGGKAKGPKVAKPVVAAKPVTAKRISAARTAGTVAKPRGLKPGVVTARVGAKAATGRQRARIDGDAFAARVKRARGTSLRRGINESDRENALSGAQRRATAPAKRFAASNQRQARADRTAAAARAFYNSYGSPMTFGRRQRLSTATSPTFGSKRRGKKKS